MDTLFDTIRGVEITPHISKTKRTPTLPQVVNVALNGLPHVQTTGVLTHQLEVEFVIHQDSDLLLLRAWEQGNLVRVTDGGITRHGYIISVELSEDYAEGYHEGFVLVQEDFTI